MTVVPVTALSQSHETPLHVRSVGPFDISCAYARSADARGDQRGQDFVAICVDAQRLAFVVCDGVGQSFYGDLAARLLGQSLAEWLWTWNGGLTEPFGAALNQFLDQLTVEGSLAVSDQALPADMPNMLREVLEQQRARGSESMVVGGRIDLPSGQSTGRLALASLGDCRVRLWDGPAEHTDLGLVPNVEHRWSTLRGCVGGAPSHALGTFDLSAGDLAVVAYSDGLAALDGQPLERLESIAGALLSDGGDWVPDDDASFLEVRMSMIGAVR